MEPDEYYDSLEEEESEDQKIDCLTQKKGLYSDSLEDDGDDVIPFYNGNLNINKISLNVQSSKCSGFLVSKSNKSKCRIPSARPRKTYLNMYYERTSDKQLADSINGENLEDDSKSLHSFTTCLDNNVSFEDIDSVYLRSNNSASEISSNYDKKKMSIPELQLDCNSAKFHSVSDNNMDSYKSPSLTNSKRNWYNKVGDYGKPEPIVPNPKLESWKKRQQYGRKVSESNRIKMNERKILKNLEKELQNSKLCAKSEIS